MQYRKFGKLNWQGSALGFGAMRLPTVDDNPMSADIDEEKAIAMIRYAIDHGVNYVDTAYPYHSGQSEVVVGKALLDGYRAKIKLATKSPVRMIKQAEDFDNFLDEQLERLKTNIDFYLLHGIGQKSWEDTVLKFGLLNKMERAFHDGKIKHIGFSFHDDVNAFKTIVDGYDKWDFCQIQYNYMDINNQAGAEGLKYAAAKGLAVVIMEPLLGGKLANPPKDILSIIQDFKPNRSPAEWALQWLWNQPEVSVVLSGMTTMEQVKENVNAAKTSQVDSFKKQEQDFINLVREKYIEKTAIPCTGCSYCLPCPNNVEIPRIFKLYNDGYIYNDVQGSRNAYLRFLPEDKRANNCIQCKECEEKCPQSIPISEWMPKVHSVLGENNPY